MLIEMFHAFVTIGDELSTYDLFNKFIIIKNEIKMSMKDKATTSCHLVLKIPFLGCPLKESGKNPINFPKKIKLAATV